MRGGWIVIIVDPMRKKKGVLHAHCMHVCMHACMDDGW